MRKIIDIIIALFFSSGLFAVNDNVATDAPAMGLGGASVALENVYGSFNNQALLGTLKSPTIATSYASRFSLNDARVAAVWPSSFGTLGLNITHYGSSLYSESKAGLAFSRMFGEHFSAALQADLLSVKPFPGEKSLYAFTAEAALWARPLEDFSIGFHLYNFINAQYETLYHDEAVPVNMKLGLTYTVYDNFLFTAEVENSSLYGTSFRGGMQYKILEKIILRTGGGSNPVLASIGLGVILGKCRIDMAAQAVRDLGKTGGVSLSYAF